MTTGRIGYPQNQYSTGQMLIDPSRSFLPDLNNTVSYLGDTDPADYQPALRDGPVARVQDPLLVPQSTNEETGQTDRVSHSVCFSKILLSRWVAKEGLKTSMSLTWLVPGCICRRVGPVQGEVVSLLWPGRQRHWRRHGGCPALATDRYPVICTKVFRTELELD